jgi:hypothetical protein
MRILRRRKFDNLLSFMVERYGNVQEVTGEF